MGVTITPHNLKLWFYLRNLAKQGQISSIWECYMRLRWLYVLQIFVLFNYVCVPVCLRMSAREGQVPTGSRIKHQIQTLLELKLQAAGSCLTWVLGTDLCQRSNNGPISLAISLRSMSITLLCLSMVGKFMSFIRIKATINYQSFSSSLLSYPCLTVPKRPRMQSYHS